MESLIQIAFRCKLRATFLSPPPPNKKITPLIIYNYYNKRLSSCLRFKIDGAPFFESLFQNVFSQYSFSFR